MQFSTCEDIDAPIGKVWGAVTDFDSFEHGARRRGAEVRRTDSGGTGGAEGAGAAWTVDFEFRGKPRRVEARVTAFEAPGHLRVDSVSGGLEGMLEVTLTSLSPRRTRMDISLELTPGSLSARLLVQSLKFARASLNRRFENRVEDFARGIETRYRESA
jgi:uncharacterized protein YndB with AHSA1/START domain